MGNNIIKNGINFECQGSAKCCVSRGSFGYVYLSLKDRKRLAKYFGLKILDFIKKYCDKNDNYYHLKELNINGDCIFLNQKKCSVYKSRPEQCRTWPFWPENMNSKSWKKDVLNYCPGIGKGKFYNSEKIKKILLRDKNNSNYINDLK